MVAPDKSWWDPPTSFGLGYRLETGRIAFEAGMEFIVGYVIRRRDGRQNHCRSGSRRRYAVAMPRAGLQCRRLGATVWDGPGCWPLGKRGSTRSTGAMRWIPRPGARAVDTLTCGIDGNATRAHDNLQRSDECGAAGRGPGRLWLGCSAFLLGTEMQAESKRDGG